MLSLLRIQRHPIDDVEPGMRRFLRYHHRLLVSGMTGSDQALQILGAQVALFATEHQVSLARHAHELLESTAAKGKLVLLP